MSCKHIVLWRYVFWLAVSVFAGTVSLHSGDTFNAAGVIVKVAVVLALTILYVFWLLTIVDLIKSSIKTSSKLLLGVCLILGSIIAAYLYFESVIAANCDESRDRVSQ